MIWIQKWFSDQLKDENVENENKKEKEEAQWLKAHCGSIDKRPGSNSVTTASPLGHKHVVGASSALRKTPWMASIGTYNEVLIMLLIQLSYVQLAK